jgi:hypothetical protein
MSDILATLLFDSWSSQPLPELRSRSCSERHLIFEGNGMILDLLLKTQNGGTWLHLGGQILPGTKGLSGVADLPVVIEQGTHRSCTQTNALGEFAFHAVRSSTFDLEITLRDRKFLVRGLSNEEPRTWRVVSALAVKA